MMWGLEPQLDNSKFIKGKNITWQQYEILTAVENAVNKKGLPRISVRAGHGIGKCLGYNTDILMFDGSIKKVQDIVVGDKIMGDDNKERNVLSLARGTEEMYRIRYNDGSFYDVNKSHILSLIATNNRGKQKTGDLTDISVSEYLLWGKEKKRTNVGYKKSIELPESKQEIDPYLLGLWLGDGSSSGGRIYNGDIEVIEYLKELGVSSISKQRGCYALNVIGLSKTLRLMGLLNNKHIPDNYLRGSKRQRLELLAGLIDTDGSITKNKRLYSITQKNKLLAHQIRWLAQSVGCHATINKYKKYCDYKGEKRYGYYWTVSISKNTNIIPVKIERKIAISRGLMHEKNNLHFAFTVNPLGIGNYYGFEIDGNRRFLLGDFTVTHNTTVFSWLILWYLFCHKDAQVPCTAPSSEQLHDVLWKEINIWLQRMPESIRKKFEWTNGYIRVKENPEVWFARARTARRESPEALAGVHGDNVFIFVDEASAVPDEIFKTAEGSLTGDNAYVIMISNPTRLAGYFYESHNIDKAHWQTMKFSSMDSPIVDKKFVERIVTKHGEDSDEYNIRVLGEFPDAESIDDKGYVQMFNESDINASKLHDFVGNKKLGVDCGAEGEDESVWVLRDNFKTKIVAREPISSSKSIAQKTMELMDYYEIYPDRVFIDNFGVGANVSQEIALASNGRYRVNALNVGDKPDNEDDFINKRAEAYYRAREWMKKGGTVVGNFESWRELLNIKFRRNIKNKVQVMSKLDMRRNGVKSPNVADAFMMTFVTDDNYYDERLNVYSYVSPYTY